MKIRWIMLGLLIVAMIILTTVGCGSSATPAATPTPEVHPGKALAEGRCGTCHAFSVIENTKYDHKGWEVSVERMILHGAALDDDQKAQVIDYLAVTYAK
jgi:hypothetical protein